ncbi:hypothetical protein [Mumia zhuanghuii]|uniref:Uncharacterized protein n=1 Tax=Mumia zhuanghuii TaxID=2585211 RepID=A0A5C4M7E6_9ACTN|nr:hypothetical protein [Mumia zhuanghuii]TNC28436.1 hypothetical protein FHE65_34005 [Mumia zhuanghuii]
MLGESDDARAVAQCTVPRELASMWELAMALPRAQVMLPGLHKPLRQSMPAREKWWVVDYPRLRAPQLF